MLKIIIPKTINIIIFKKNNFSDYEIIFYKKSFFYKILFHNSNIHVNNSLNFFFIQKKTPILYKNLIQFFLKNLLNSLEYYIIKKIKFTGKSYRVEKDIYYNSLLLKFGHAIRTYAKVKHMKLKHSKKYQLMLKCSNVFFLKIKINKILNVRF